MRTMISERATFSWVALIAIVSAAISVTVQQVTMNERLAALTKVVVDLGADLKSVVRDVAENKADIRAAAAREAARPR